MYLKALSRTVDFAYVYVFSLLKEPEVWKHVSDAEISVMYLLMKILKNIVGGPKLFLAQYILRGIIWRHIIQNYWSNDNTRIQSYIVGTEDTGTVPDNIHVQSTANLQ